MARGKELRGEIDQEEQLRFSAAELENYCAAACLAEGFGLGLEAVVVSNGVVGVCHGETTIGFGPGGGWRARVSSGEEIVFWGAGDDYVVEEGFADCRYLATSSFQCKRLIQAGVRTDNICLVGRVLPPTLAENAFQAWRGRFGRAVSEAGYSRQPLRVLVWFEGRGDRRLYAALVTRLISEVGKNSNGSEQVEVVGYGPRWGGIGSVREMADAYHDFRETLSVTDLCLTDSRTGAGWMEGYAIPYVYLNGEDGWAMRLTRRWPVEKLAFVLQHKGLEGVRLALAGRNAGQTERVSRLKQLNKEAFKTAATFLGLDIENGNDYQSGFRRV